jgi:endonuclease/exonuclease/phosphatase family metal-dependent hydrolase
LTRPLRTIGLGLVVLLTTVFAVHPRGQTTSEAGAPLRVMTYNIAAGTRGLDGVAGTIRAAAPDLVALQEVDVHWAARSGFADEARDLAERLRMDVRFAPIYDLPPLSAGAPQRQFGVALLSRHPIAAFANRDLTRLSTQEASPAPALAPGLLEARVDVNGTAVRVFNTHLDYRADPAVRRTQVEEMVAAIGDDAAPTLVFGDLNAEAAAPELAPLLERLHDAWPASSGPGFTYPAEAPAKRIDFVLTSGHFRVRSAAVADSTASDHRPVIVDLMLGH